MNDPSVIKKRVKIPSPKSFALKPLSDLAQQLLRLPLWEKSGDELVLRDIANRAYSSMIHQTARSSRVNVSVETRYDPENKIMRVYRRA